MPTPEHLPVVPPVGPAWELAKAERNWLVYRLVPQPSKKPKKIPQSGSGKNVAAKAAASLSFDQAQELATRLGLGHGIGYLPRAGSAMVCVDFDGVLNDGVVEQDELPGFTSYAERSPSGTGLHVLVVRPADIEPTTFDDGEDWVGLIASDSKFFTVTMARWGSNSEVVEDRALVDWALARRAERNSGGENSKKKRLMSDEARESLRRLHQSDKSVLWFYRLPPEARAKCAREMLAVLPVSFARVYDTWVKAGMALKLADEDFLLFEVWDDWSQRAPNYDGQTEVKWASFADHFDDRLVSATVRTIIYWAKGRGWDPTPWEEAAMMHDRTRAEAAFARIKAKRHTLDDGLTDVLEVSETEVAGDGAVDFLPDHLTRPGGLVEALIEYGAARSPRETRLPALAGALAAASALTDRHYIIETPGFLTSPGLQVVLVSETGTGKETARDVVYAVCGLRSSVALADSYASAPALHLALANAPTQLWANDEFGRYLKVAANPNGTGAHDFALITMAMKLHTMFEKFLPERVYSQGSNRARVDHPLLVAMHTTTPKALFDAMDADTVVDGMLGRLLVIQQDGRPPLKPLGKKSSDPLPAEVRDKINRQGGFIRQAVLARLGLQIGEPQGSVNTDQVTTQWLPGQQSHRFIPISAGEDAMAHFEPIRSECEKRAALPGVAAALWSRAYEQILRVAGVVAFGQAVWDDNLGNPTIRLHNLLWARDLVFWCLEQLVPAAEEHASEGERDALQKAIVANLRKLRAADGLSGWVRKQELLARLKGRGRSYRDLKEEVVALIECGDVEVKLGDDGCPERPEMVRLAQ